MAVRTAADYRNLLTRLLPRGLAWEACKTIGTTAYKLIDAMSVELARIDGRANDLLNEADPSTTLGLLEDWERIVGIPDGCQQRAEATSTRQADVVRKLKARGGQSRQYFIDLAASLGYLVTISEYRRFRAGRSVSGVACYGGPWLFTWKVNAGSVIAENFRSGISRAGERLGISRNNLLECVMTQKKPAHTFLNFNYEG